jgi:hypothetical protein
MARRGARKARRRRSPKSIKILNVAEAYLQGSYLTQLAFKTNPISFFLGGGAGGSTGFGHLAAGGVPGFVSGGGIGITELVRDPSVFGQIMTNVSNPTRVVETAIKSAVTNAGFRMAKRALRRPINSFNRQIARPLGLGVTL